MKTLIIGLFGLALLAASPAWGAAKEPPYPLGLGPIGPINAVCNATAFGGNGALVIVVNKDSSIHAKICPGVGLEGSLPDPTMEAVTIGNLGTIVKYKKEGVTDPCEWWVIGGTSYLFCW